MNYDTFGGVYPAMCTPFHDDDSIDFQTLRDDARRLEAAGVDGLVPVGSTGESATLSHEEHVEVVEAVVDAAEDVPVIAGSGSNNTDEALSLSRRSVEAGADGLLLISPYYNKPEQQAFSTTTGRSPTQSTPPRSSTTSPAGLDRISSRRPPPRSPNTRTSRATRPRAVTSARSVTSSSARAQRSLTSSRATTE